MKIRAKFFTSPAASSICLRLVSCQRRLNLTSASRSLPVGEDAQVLDGLSVGEIVTGAAKGDSQVLAQAHAVAGSFQALLQPGRGDLDHAGQAVVGAYAGVEHDGHVQQEGGALEHAVDGPGRQHPVQPDPAFPAVGRQCDDDHHREGDYGDQNVDTRSCDEAGNGVERGERAGPRDWVGEPGQAGNHAIGHDAQQEHHHGGQRRGIEQRLPDGGADPGLGLDQGDGIAHGLNQVAAHLAGLDQRSLLGG